MMAPHEHERKDDQSERRKWNAFWSELPTWVKGSILIALGATGSASGIGIGGSKADDPLATRVTVIETKFDSMKEQLNRIENKLDRRR